MARNPFNPNKGASDNILDWYNADPNAITVGQDSWKKAGNPLLVDYGPAGMKFQNAIRAILDNPDDPAFAPYVKDLYSAGVALQKGSDQALMASTIGAYLREGARNYQSNMSVNGDLTTGVDAWKRLDPSTRNALLVQFYKQGSTPKRALKNAMIAAQNGVPYVPRVGEDGAGATYLANEPAIIQALADGPASLSDRWNATNDRAKLAADQRSVRNPAGRITDPAAHVDAQGPVDPAQPSSAYGAPAASAAGAPAPEEVRRLTRVNASNAGSVFESGSAPVQYLPSPEFNDRFGNWTMPTEERPQQASRPIGVFADEPGYVVPPPIWGLEDPGNRRNDAEEWFSRWIRPLLRQE